MSNKIITDDILQKAIQDTIQIIADNIFEFESYSDESIAELFSLTPEEAQHISDLIADTVISQYKLWSSKKVSDELLSAKNECNDYTDTRLSNISSISLKYCTVLPSVGESNCIYILKSTDSNPDTLNLYDGTWVTIGNFTIKLDDYYKKSQIDTKLDLKADKTEILAQDDVITDTSLATTSNVLSATTTIEELDKKVGKTSIVTSVDSSSTDDTVPSAKVVYDNCIKDNNLKSYTTLEQLGLTAPTTVSEIYNAMPNNSICRIKSLNYAITDTPTDYGVLKIDKIDIYSFDIEFKRSKSNIVTGCNRWIGQLKGDDGTGLTWKRLCTTSVNDVAKTTITFSDVTNYKNADNGNAFSYYYVQDGICHLSIYLQCVSPVNTSTRIACTSDIPKPKTPIRKIVTPWELTNYNVAPIFFCLENTSQSAFIMGGNVGTKYLLQFSYPVAES